jgi:hypothetical protein
LLNFIPTGRPEREKRGGDCPGDRNEEQQGPSKYTTFTPLMNK